MNLSPPAILVVPLQKTCLRKCKWCCTAAVGERTEKMWEKQPCGNQGQRIRKEQRFHCSPCRRPWWHRLSLVYVFVSHYPILFFLICNKLNQFSPSWVFFAHDGNWWVIFLVLISTHKTFHLFFCHCLADEEEWESGLVGTWQPAKVNPPQLGYKQTTERTSF